MAKTTTSIKVSGTVQYTTKDPSEVWFRAIETKAQEKIQVYLPLEVIKETVLNSLNSYINSHRKRSPIVTNDGSRLTPDNNLYNVIASSTEIIREDNGVYRLGIGKISFLNKYAPYWRVVNNGGYIPPQTTGFFGEGYPPTYGVGGDMFTQGRRSPITRKKYFLNPTKPISPMRYLSHMDRVFRREIEKFTKQKNKT